MRTIQLNRIGVVVRDLDRAVTDYERLYGITSWMTSTAAPGDAVSHGRVLRQTPGTWRSAVGSTAPRPGDTGPGDAPAYPVTFELVEPLSGESPFHEQLRTKREGITFLQVAVDGTEADIAEHFRGLDIEPAFQATVDGTTRVFWDTRRALGGFYVEMVPESATDAVEASAGASADADADAPLPTQGIHHFGVLVHDVLDSLPAYRDIFGITRFEAKTWETGFGRLDAPQYRGEKMDHGYFTAQGHAGNFGFEIIQSNHGDSHYNREFFDERGPGIHHIFSWMTREDAAWDETVAAMTAAGHPLCMGSTLRGEAAEFGYFDTFDALGGYLVEAVVRRRPAAPEYMAPDWVIDFEELA